MRATLKTLNQMLSDNENLLNFVTVPTDITDIDEATLKLAIIRRCGDVEPYYQRDTDFQLFGALWFNSHSFLFRHALSIWNATYNPIENYDRTETETINDTSTDTRSGSDQHSGTDTTTTTGTDTNTETHGGTTGKTNSTTRENEIAGFNSANYSDANQETETGTETTTHGETVSNNGQTSGSETVAHGETITRSEETTAENERTRNMRIHGNIGVTTSQQMLESEMEIGNKFWIYDYIASAFESDNFITVYKSYYDEVQFDDV